GGGNVVFLNGACGDVTQVDNLSVQESEFGEKWSRRVGQKVGAEALKVLCMGEKAELAPLAGQQKYVTLKTREVSEQLFQDALVYFKSDPPQGWDRWLARDLILLHEQTKWEAEVQAEVQAIQVGPAVFLANGSEYFCQFGLNIKHRSQFPFTFVVELANQSIGYVPVPEAMGPKGGGYEPTLCLSSKLVPEAGQMIEDASVELAVSLTPGAVPEGPTVPPTSAAWDVNTSKMATV
ncbi:MAG: hypothetical protein WCP21_10415, partial [Armatimonadota bacterium]